MPEKRVKIPSTAKFSRPASDWPIIHIHIGMLRCFHSLGPGLSGGRVRAYWTAKRPPQRGGALDTRAVVLAAALLALGGCRGGAPLLKTEPNLLLVVVDTLRADRLGSYGYAAPTSPNIDAFASDAVVYTDAVSPAPFTMPAMAAMLTGHYPDRTGVVNHARSFILDTPIATLAERLRRAGYDSAAVVANPWLANRDMRFNRGIRKFITRTTLKRSSRLKAATVTDHALASLGLFEAGPAFLWVHYMDTHMPYEPPVRLARMFGNRTGTSAVIRLFRKPGVAPQRVYFANDLDRGAVEQTRALYDAAVREVDEQIGRLLAALRDRRLLDRTIVIITADHGESLGDHGLYFAHDFTLYDELMRVPLLVRIPGVAAARINAPVSPMDIVPSLCVWLRLGCKDSFDGRILPLRSPTTPASRPRTLFGAAAPARQRYARNPFIHAEGIDGRWTMARRSDRKLIKIPLGGGKESTNADWQAYDLKADPGEIRNLLAPAQVHRLADWPADLRELRSSLAAWEAEMKRTRHLPAARETDFDQPSRKRLESLGYLQ